jgi:protease-4
MKDLLLAVINIFRYTGKIFTAVRNMIFNIVLIVILIAVVGTLIPGDRVQIPENTILRLDISGNIVEERKILSMFERLLGSSVDPENTDPETVLQDILDVIDNAAADDRIAVLLLNLKHMEKAGLNQLQAIGQALDDFKASGKTIVAAEDFYSQSQYYLAAYADKIIVNPMGGVDIHGFGVYRLYFREALEKLSVTYNIFKVGTYKSALEPFTRDDMSPEDRQQNQTWLSALWQVYIDDIQLQRNISREMIDNYTNNTAAGLESTKGNTAQLALKTGLVDQIWTRPQITAYLTSLTKTTEEKLHTLSSSDYYKTIQPSFSQDPSVKEKIGLIVAEGNILPGKQPPGIIGGDSLAALIRKARENKQVKAVVLRINSGGGSAFASEIIRQELLELKKKGKPLVVSMGAVAASGGYWIAADANEIWASAATITGSIGIFGAIPTFEKTLASVGIYNDGTGTTPLASGLDLTQPLPDQLKGIIQQAIANNYDQFLQIVADGRKMEKRQVGELAEGRVYDGKTAQAFGLIDKLGTLEDAIEAAARLAGIEEYGTEYISPPESVSDQFFQFLTAKLPAVSANRDHHPVLARLKKILASRLENYLLLDDPQGIYAHCLINLTI